MPPSPPCSGGFFFAVKEVSLHDKGAQESILQLEQVRIFFGFLLLLFDMHMLYNKFSSKIAIPSSVGIYFTGNRSLKSV